MELQSRFLTNINDNGDNNERGKNFKNPGGNIEKYG